jgi:predicted ATPase
LALELASRIGAAFADGVAFVDLAPVTDENAVVPALASACRTEPPDDDTDPFDAWERVFAQRAALIVLDNCEHLLGAARDLATRIVRAAPRCAVVATSRIALGVPGEIVHRLGGLAPPDAAQLFVERARAATRFLPDPDLATVARICRRLDGLPLAVELTAPRLRVLRPEQLARMLDARVTLLSGSARAQSRRQQTVRDTIAWSYHLLDPAERAVFVRLSVFAGAWRPAVANAICTFAGEGDAREPIERLVEKSLVERTNGPGGPWYRLLETVRAFGAEQLDSAERTRLRARFVDAYVAVAFELDRGLRGREEAEAAGVLEAEQDNLRLALQYAFESPEMAPQALALCAHLGWSWLRSGRSREARAWLARAIALPLPASVERATALTNYARVCSNRRDYQRAAGAALEALRTSRTIGNRYLEGQCLSTASVIAHERQRYRRAMVLALRSLRILREVGAPDVLCRGLVRLAMMYEESGDVDAAEELYVEAEATMRALGSATLLYGLLVNRSFVAFTRGEFARALAMNLEALALFEHPPKSGLTIDCLNNVAVASAELDDLDRAWEYARRALALALEIEDAIGAAQSIETCAHVAAARSEWVRAARLFAAADANGRARDRLNAFDRDRRDRTIELVRQGCGPQRFILAWNAGAKLESSDAAKL